MIAQKPLIEYTVVSGNLKPLPVIIAAAGSSIRMGGVNKQTLSVGGLPVIARTLLAFENCPYISKIILVCKSDDTLLMQSICGEYKISKICDIISGGETRHESVIKGIKRLSAEDETVLIHDGARPFVNDRMICDCISALNGYDGCVTAVKVSDTVKRCGKDTCAEKTVDRENLYLAQTPQGVKVKPYLLSCEKGGDYTDDAAVLEAAGYKVKIVAGDKRNIKITTPDDIPLAEAMINGGIV